MRLKSNKIVIALVISLSFLINVSNSAALNQTVDLEKGDKFTFTIQHFEVSYMTNGTEYANPPTDVSEGEVDVEITGFKDVGSYTYVNYSRVLENDNTKAEASYLRAFNQYAGLIYFYASFVLTYGPEAYAFTSTPNPLFTTPNPYGMPFFSTNDEDLYESFSNDPNFSEEFNKKQTGQNLTETDIENSIDKAANTYHLKYFVHYIRVGESLKGEDFMVDYDAKYIVDVDYGRSVFTKFQYKFDYHSKLGEATRDIVIDFSFIEGEEKDGGLLDRVPVNLFFVLLALGTLPILSRKIKN